MINGKIALALVIMLLVPVCFAETSGSISVAQPSQFWGVTLPSTTTTTTSTTTTTDNSASASSGPANTATTTTLPFRTQSWQSMSSGSSYSISNFDAGIGFTGVNITMGSSASGVSITIKELSGRPVIVTMDPNGTAYKYTEVITANLPDSSITSAKIQFHIERWWLSLNRLDKNAVSLQRWNSGVWNKLPTTFVNETDNYDIYEATTPGFSVFAITAGPIGSATTTTVSSTGTTIGSNATAKNNSTGNQTELFPGLSGSSGSMLLIAVVIAAIIIIAAILYIKRDVVKKYMPKKGYHYHKHKQENSHSEHHEHKGEEKK